MENISAATRDSFSAYFNQSKLFFSQQCYLSYKGQERLLIQVTINNHVINN